MSFFEIKNLSKGLDGLVVEGSAVNNNEYVIENIYSPDFAFGDRGVKIPVSFGGLFISADFLTETDNPHREYTTESPFGQYLYEGTFIKGDLNIAFTKFDNALSVTIYESKGGSQKTIYSQNFFAGADQAKSHVDSVLEGKSDPEDLVFHLESCKEMEKTNG